MIARRSLIAGLGALIASPAIVKASSLMQIAPTETIKLASGSTIRFAGLNVPSYNNYLTLGMITRDAVRLFRNSNSFINDLDNFDELFAQDNAKIGSSLRIRLPNDYVAADPMLSVQNNSIAPPVAMAALVMAATPVVEQVLNKPMSRRFWNT